MCKCLCKCLCNVQNKYFVVNIQGNCSKIDQKVIELFFNTFAVDSFLHSGISIAIDDDIFNIESCHSGTCLLNYI